MLSRRLSIIERLAALTCLSIGLACSGVSTHTDSSTLSSASSTEGAGHFGIGSAPTADEIAAWDVDVGPSGVGLPLGSGSVPDGLRLYVEQCQRCHGPEGRGGPFDVLAGRLPDDAFPFAQDLRAKKTIGNYWPWATTVFDYTRRAMPLDRPGSLTNDDVYALTAYLLHLNDLIEADVILDQDTLPEIVMPARDRFVPDDRRGGDEVR